MFQATKRAVLAALLVAMSVFLVLGMLAGATGSGYWWVLMFPAFVLFGVYAVVERVA